MRNVILRIFREWLNDHQKEYMNISVIVVAYNEEKNIQTCIESILSQIYSRGLWEILVIDGNSEDSTVKIVEDLQEKTNRVRLLKNPARKISPGRNIGLRESAYPFVAFTDADCKAPSDWLEKLSVNYEILLESDKNTAAAGGGNIPPEGFSNFHKALEIYLDSFLGCFNSPQGRNFKTIKKVNSLSCTNVLYKKQLLLEIDGFDNNLGNISEDNDLNYRLRQKGYNLYFIPFMPVYHKLRENLPSWLKNMALYGKGRAMFTFKHRNFLSPFYVIPFTFAVAMLLTPLFFLNHLFILPLLYFPFIIMYVFAVTIKKRRCCLFWQVLIIFIGTHFVYSINLFLETLRLICRKTSCFAPI